MLSIVRLEVSKIIIVCMGQRVGMSVMFPAFAKRASKDYDPGKINEREASAKEYVAKMALAA